MKSDLKVNGPLFLEILELKNRKSNLKFIFSIHDRKLRKF